MDTVDELKAALKEACLVIREAPVLIIDRQVAAIRGETEAVAYAQSLDTWHVRAKDFLERTEIDGNEEQPR